MSAIHYLGRMIRKNAIPVATLAGDAGFSCLSPECHKVSHENDPIHLLPSALTTPFQGLGEGRCHRNSSTVFGTFFPQHLRAAALPPTQSPSTLSLPVRLAPQSHVSNHTANSEGSLFASLKGPLGWFS